MLRKKTEMVRDERSEMRGGKGTIQTLELLTETELMGKGRLFSIMTIEPGCSIGLHDHIGEAETYYILRGVGIADDNGTEVVVEPGDILYTGDGHHHSIRNEGSETLEFLAMILYK